MLLPPQTHACGCNGGMCCVLVQLITCSTALVIRTEPVLRLPAGTASCQGMLGSAFSHLFSHSCYSLSLRVGNRILSYSCSIVFQENLHFSRLSQSSGKQRRRWHRMFCFWSTTATAGAFRLHCAQDPEPSGKAGTGSPFNPLSSTHNSGGLTGSCHMKPSAWKPVKEVGLFRSVI